MNNTTTINLDTKLGFLSSSMCQAGRRLQRAMVQPDSRHVNDCVVRSALCKANFTGTNMIRRRILFRFEGKFLMIWKAKRSMLDRIRATPYREASFIVPVHLKEQSS